MDDEDDSDYSWTRWAGADYVRVLKAGGGGRGGGWKGGGQYEGGMKDSTISPFLGRSHWLNSWYVYKSPAHRHAHQKNHVWKAKSNQCHGRNLKVFHGSRERWSGGDKDDGFKQITWHKHLQLKRDSLVSRPQQPSNKKNYTSKHLELGWQMKHLIASLSCLLI